MKPAQIRFYIDADILGLAQVMAKLRPDVTYPGDPGGTVKGRVRPACPILTPQTDDDVWIPTAAQNGWLIISRDRQIAEHSREIQAVRDHRAGMVTLSGSEAIGTWRELEVLMCQWRKIDGLVGLPGPFIYLAGRTSFRKLV